jgi:spermidine/putrescine transport system permease protein
VSADVRAAGNPPRGRGVRAWLANPWAEARFLWILAIAYSLWALLPVVIAIVYSFNSGRSLTSLQGLSLRWYLWDVSSVRHDAQLRSALLQSFKLTVCTVAIAVPFGVAFALALDRWRSRVASGTNFVMLFSFITPELAVGVALFLFFTQLVRAIGVGFPAQVLGLSMFQLAYTVIIVRARLLSIGRQYEEAAMDLGASPVQALRRVLIPLVMPAILASFAIVFATSIDNFVISQQLSAGAQTQTVPILIYSSARRAPLPSLNALATITLLSSTLLIIMTVAAYRRWTRDERPAEVDTARIGLPV